MQGFSLQAAHWFCAPKHYEITENSVRMVTDAQTDFWQRTYYGFEHDNAHFLYHETSDAFFSFTVKVSFDYKTCFDQCGIAVYLNSDNWFKACIEYQHEQAMWLGSVVTTNGYSDWASSEIGSENTAIWYRLSRRNSDYLIEHSLDGKNFQQMRIFHFSGATENIKLGLMAASPGNSSFTAFFSHVSMMPCQWNVHAA